MQEDRGRQGKTLTGLIFAEGILLICSTSSTVNRVLALDSTRNISVFSNKRKTTLFSKSGIALLMKAAFYFANIIVWRRPISVGLLTCQGPINQKYPLTCQHTHTFFCDFIIIAYKTSRAFLKFILAAHFTFMAAHLPGIIRCTYHYSKRGFLGLNPVQGNNFFSFM